MEFLLYIVLGACAGVLAGLFGVGGGLIIVPALVFSFTAHGFGGDVLTQMAVGTSLATIVFTSINSILEHHRRGAVRWPVFAWMTLGILVGSALGALTAAQIKGPLLQKIIGVFAILVALQMVLDLKPKGNREVPGKGGLTLAGAVIGWASAIFGIGGGSLTVPFLSWRSVPMQQAVATSSACGLPIAISAPCRSSRSAGTTRSCRSGAWATSICRRWSASPPPVCCSPASARVWRIVCRRAYSSDCSPCCCSAWA